MAAPPGAVVKLYVDTDRMLQVGDGVTTQTGRRYEILELRVQARGKWAGIRRHLVCRVMHPDEPDRDYWIPIRWYRR
jgi:hypothetical protein